MIMQNGTIELKQTTGGGINPDTGFPNKPTTETWDEPIPCQYYANKYNNLGRVDGMNFKTASYTILIEEQPFNGEQVRLKSLDGNTVGEFSVISVELLEAVCELKVLV